MALAFAFRTVQRRPDGEAN